MSPEEESPVLRRKIAVGLFLLTLGVYALFAGGHTYSSDEEGLFLTTQSLVEHRSPVIVVDEGNNRVLPITTGRTGAPVTVGGLGQSLVAAPLYVLGSLAGTGIHGGNYGNYPERLFVGWTNSIVTALSVAVVFLLSLRMGVTRRRAVALSFVYAFATFAFPHAKTFFSEPLAATLSLTSLFFVVRSGQDRTLGAAALAGLSIGFGLHARASVALFVPVLGLYLLWLWARPHFEIRKLIAPAGAFGGAFSVTVALLLLSNWWRFGSPFNLGYATIPLDYPIQDGLYGLFLSPGKSIFVYAPIVALGLLAPILAGRGHRSVAGVAVVLGLLNALFFARFPYWHGDHSYGPRYLMLSLPFLVIPAGVLLDRRWARLTTLGCAVLGGTVALLGAVMYFNQYFNIAEHESVPKLEILADGPNYWRKMHYDPYWSPPVGTARALPEVVENTLKRADGHDAALQQYPGTTNEQYGWYFAPPQADSWIYWLFATHGPKRFLVLAPFWLVVALVGVRILRPGLRA